MALYKLKSAKELESRVRQGEIGFPLKRLYIKTPLQKMFADLVKFSGSAYKRLVYYRKCRIKNYNRSVYSLLPTGKNLMILNEPSDYKDYNILSDLLGVEEVRMQCNVLNLPSPYRFFFDNVRHVGEVALARFGKITPYTLSQTMWKMHGTKECTSFRPTILPTILFALRLRSGESVRILDPSSGWGDRLISAIAIAKSGVNVYYTGVDPNPRMAHKYRTIISDLQSSKANFTMINAPFEDAKISSKFDLVFTSPPYFDLERYGDESDQSISRYKTMNDWTIFIQQYCRKAWSHLYVGGYMVIVINQKRGEHYVEDLIDFITAFRDSDYLGLLPYAERGRFNDAQPIFIWKKQTMGGNRRSFSLRAFKPGDIPDMIRIMGDSKNMDNIARGRVLTPDQVSEKIHRYIVLDRRGHPLNFTNNNGAYGKFWAITVNKRIIGMIGIYHGSYKDRSLTNRIYVRILIDHNHRMRGYAKKAIIALLDKLRAYAKKNHLRVPPIYAMVAVDNTASMALFNKKIASFERMTYFNGKKHALFTLSV